MKLLFWKKDELGCKWLESCKCKDKRENACGYCQFYFQIDSGFGYCRALPSHVLTAWCRDICSLFKSNREV